MTLLFSFLWESIFLSIDFVSGLIDVLVDFTTLAGDADFFEGAPVSFALTGEADFLAEVAVAFALDSLRLTLRVDRAF